MRYRHLLVVLISAFALWFGGCASHSLCTTAAVHVSNCLGTGYVASSACSADDAKFVLQQSCESLTAARKPSYAWAPPATDPPYEEVKRCQRAR